jgi:predicted SAM-dependent methyltransferase
MKLHLGCYGKKIEGFVNVDIREEVKPDLVDNVFELKKVENNSAELIYASHVLEHADYIESEAALKRWHQVLKSGGVLRLSVPDMEAHFAHYFYHKNLRALNSALWGSQRHPYDYHKNGWDFNQLKKELIEIGFTDIKRYDWRKTEHCSVDDYSQAYFPHMDKENGKLMSLNIEATKI